MKSYWMLFLSFVFFLGAAGPAHALLEDLDAQRDRVDSVHAKVGIADDLYKDAKKEAMTGTGCVVSGAGKAKKGLGRFWSGLKDEASNIGKGVKGGVSMAKGLGVGAYELIMDPKSSKGVESLKAGSKDSLDALIATPGALYKVLSGAGLTAVGAIEILEGADQIKNTLAGAAAVGCIVVGA